MLAARRKKNYIDVYCRIHVLHANTIIYANNYTSKGFLFLRLLGMGVHSYVHVIVDVRLGGQPGEVLYGDSIRDPNGGEDLQDLPAVRPSARRVSKND